MRTLVCCIAVLVLVPVVEASTHFDDVAKIAIIGPERAGKSCLVRKLIDATFSSTYAPSFGVDFRLHTLTVDGKQTRLHLWDTSGAAKHAVITRAYYKTAQSILVVYDASDPDALDQVSEWLSQVNTFASKQAAVVLAGTKTDLLSDSERQRVCSRANAIVCKAGASHVLTSSKTGVGVRPVFELLASEAHRVTVRWRPAARQSAKSAISCCYYPPSCAPCMPFSCLGLESWAPSARRIEST